jgi:hypothetical protein
VVAGCVLGGALRVVVARTQLGDQVGGVEGGVYGEGFGDDEEGGGECCDGELFS